MNSHQCNFKYQTVLFLKQNWIYENLLSQGRYRIMRDSLSQGGGGPEQDIPGCGAWA